MHSAEACNRSTLQKRIATDKGRNPMSKRLSSFFLGHIFYSRYATRCKIRDSDNERALPSSLCLGHFQCICHYGMVNIFMFEDFEFRR